MKIRPVGAELFRTDGQTGRQTWCSWYSTSIMDIYFI